MRVMATASLAVLVPSVSGQESTATTSGWLRVLPVGDAPPFRQEIREGVRHQMDTPEGALPPRELAVPAREGQSDDEKNVSLKLGRVSQAFLVNAGPVLLSDRQETGQSQAWTKIKMPEGSAALAVMFRDPKGESWESALSIVLPDDASSFPAGRVRLVNASPFMVNVSFQGKKIAMRAGEVLLRQPIKGGAIKDEPLQVAVRDDKGRTKRIFDASLSQDTGERTNVIIYRADGEKPRRPARVLLQRERPVNPRSDGNSG